MSNFRPHPLPFTSKDPRMNDATGEGEAAIEPAYALARKIKEKKHKRDEAKATKEKLDEEESTKAQE
ncbi:unnamed protein product [Fusarium fujikuroi]|uniref:Uncharacterized protein n=1 Tax=Fusarium fujikuroi TaxID=5127 RepID=A0A9Q9RQ52_FUSFU|nr:unnamed protein product [Fusarium fujikuroi]VTT72285.1 unnamed protein product [Fusarium fujikuroi]VZH91403.1 unnamed protein product [Fusarium fujikuroi]